MLFRIVKAYAKISLKIYCREIIINHPGWLQAKGPLLLACNHPNSFLDGIILTTLFRENVYSLVRGDAFRRPWHDRLLRWLNLLPVYRTSEGVENLEHNYTTFDTCKEVFKNGGIVIIFSEGRCVNEWHLRPLRKGTARLATSAWDEGIPLRVLPVGFNYNPYRNFGKNVFLNFGQPLNGDEVMTHRTDGRMFLTFNEQLKASLGDLVFEIDGNDLETIRETLTVQIPWQKKVVLALPALVGFVLHAPLYFAAKTLTKHYFDNDHFDSSLVAMLVLAYPFYLLLWMLITGLMICWTWTLLVFFLLPFTAWSCVQLKPQT